MTDRELLEKAARAAGLRIVRWENDEPLIYFDKLRKWRPLHDQAQARNLRHLCKLSMPNVLAADGGKSAYRRAIVRAAAAMGDSNG
jgi:hypothetical protein